MGCSCTHGLSPAHLAKVMTCLPCWPSAVSLQAHRCVARSRIPAWQAGVKVVLCALAGGIYKACRSAWLGGLAGADLFQHLQALLHLDWWCGQVRPAPGQTSRDLSLVSGVMWSVRGTWLYRCQPTAVQEIPPGFGMIVICLLS